jgi:hypothetical protein
VRPLVIINGPREGPVPDICGDFGLEPDSQVIRRSPRGKLRALKVGVAQLLQEEKYRGPFAVTDDDAILPANG